MSESLKDLSKVQLIAETQALKAENMALRTENLQQKEEIAFLKAELLKLRRLIFGQKRERFVPEDDSQLGLGFETEQKAASGATEEITYSRRKAKKHTPHARQPLPAHLVRKEILIEPEEDVEGLKKVGEEVTEELEYEPASLFVNRYVRPKYAKAGDEGVIIADLPSRPIEKGIAGPGLLSHILISKYVDHQPLYRQRKILLRSQVDLALSTLEGWVKQSGDLLIPLREVQWMRILSASYLQVDETTIQVLDKNRRGKSHRGYFWVFHDPIRREVYFHYDPGRGGNVVKDLLANFSGYLQNDGLRVYDQFRNSKTIILVGCMAHGRRKFKEALTNDRPRAEWMLKRLQDLYAIERRAHEEKLTHQERYDLRQEKAKPIMDDIKTYLNENYPHVKPKSSIGKAIGYMLRQWPKLKTYLKDGRLEIDNNLVENAIRPVALGRKNYLFAGSHEGARRAAIIYALVANAQLQGLEPFAYLRDVLARLPDYPHKQVAELLPANWKNQS